MALGERFARWFRGEPDHPGKAAATDRLRLAAAVLLVEVARADYDEDPAEFDAVERAIRERFGLDAAAAGALIDEARNHHEDVVSLHQPIAEINATMSIDEKRGLLQELWRVAYADGDLHHYEEHQMRRICELLFLSHQDYIRAKLAAGGG